jgi:hypothetical protein
LKSVPQREEIVDWYVRSQSGGMNYLFIPQGHSNAFIGVIAGTKSPTIALLDYDLVVKNLINQGYDEEDAIRFADSKSEEPSDYGPLLVHTYPEIHPKL